MDNKKLNNLRNPFFIISLMLLITNDFYLKGAYGNVITGKLSDFAGLFAFPFFFACLIPKHKKSIHILTGLLFIWWKSSFSQTFIDSINSIGIPIDRIVDFSDNMALISILFSYIIFNLKIKTLQLKPLIIYPIMAISCFAFVATSLPVRSAMEFTEVNKEYEFALPMNKFIQQVNELQIKEINKLNKAYLDDFYDADAGVFYTKDRDTITYLINIDNHKQNDTIKFNNFLSDIQIYEKGKDTTILKLINIAIMEKNINHYGDTLVNPLFNYNHRTLRYGCNSLNPDLPKYKDKAIRRFEKQVIKKLKK